MFEKLHEKLEYFKQEFEKVKAMLARLIAHLEKGCPKCNPPKE